MAKHNPWEVSEIQYWLFVCFGMGAIESKSKCKYVLYRLYSGVFNLAYWLYSVFCLIEVILQPPKEFGDVFTQVAILLVSAGIGVKRVLMEFSKNKVREVQEVMTRDFERPEIKYVKSAQYAIARNNKEYNKFIYSVYLSGLMVVYTYAVSPAFNDKKVLPIPFPFLELVDGIEYQVAYTCQFIIMITIYISYFAYDTLVWSYLLRICVRQEIIALNWINFGKTFPTIDFTKYIEGYRDYDTENDDNDFGDLESQRIPRGFEFHSYDHHFSYDKNLMMEVNRCMKDHGIQYRELMKETKMIEDCFSLALLIQLVGGAIVLALLVVFVTMADLRSLYGIRVLIFSLATTLDLFMYCYYGTKLEEKTNALKEAVYGFPWYEIDARSRKYFLSVLQLQQNKLRFTAGGFDQINLDGFLTVLRISYNFLALLRSSTND